MTPTNLDAEKFRRSFVLLLVVAISAAFLATIRAFLMSLLLAAVFTGLFRPLYRWLHAAFKGRANVAAGATLVLVLVALVGPLLTFTSVVTAQAVQVSQRVAPWIAERVDERSAQPGGLLEGIEVPEFLEPYRAEILSRGAQVAGRAGSFLVNALAAATRGTVTFLFMLFVMLYSMYFFLRDGRALLDRILYYMPLTAEDERRLVERFGSVARATIKGTLVIGVVQGTLAGVAFAVVGIEGPAFWGTVMAVLSIIPGLGTALVWVPAVIYLLALGQLGAGAGLAIWCVAVVGTADNLLRPTLVGKDTQMPDLLILLSTLGGLLLFGAPGIVVGPIVAALFVSVWEIYGVTFRDALPEHAALPAKGDA